MTCQFKVIGGGVFAMTPNKRPSSLASRVNQDQRPICYRENDWNRCAFENILTSDRWNNFEKNLAFAQAACVAWEVSLSKMKLQSDKRLFVSNRLYGWQDTVGGFVEFHIIPTLHLYSVGEGSAELDRLYCITEDSTDSAWDFRTQKLISLTAAREMVTAEPVQEPLDAPPYRQLLS